MPLKYKPQKTTKTKTQPTSTNPSTKKKIHTNTRQRKKQAIQNHHNYNENSITSIDNNNEKMAKPGNSNQSRVDLSWMRHELDVNESANKHDNDEPGNPRREKVLSMCL